MATERKIAVFTMYKGDRYFDEGTVYELAKSSGMTVQAIKKLASPSGKATKAWTVVEARELCDYFVEYEKVDYEHLIGLIKKYKYTHKEIGEVIEGSESKVYQKLNQRSRFSENELAELEDLFFLEKGKLLKKTKKI